MQVSGVRSATDDEQSGVADLVYDHRPCPEQRVLALAAHQTGYADDDGAAGQTVALPDRVAGARVRAELPSVDARVQPRHAGGGHGSEGAGQPDPEVLPQ